MDSDWNMVEAEEKEAGECFGEEDRDDVMDDGSLDGGVTTTLNMTVRQERAGKI